MRHVPLFIITILLMSAIWSCRSVKYVPIPSKSDIKDSVNIIDSLILRYETRTIDSIFIKDSTVIVQDNEGNVIKEKYYRETERYRCLERDFNELKRKYEELKKEKTDSIQVPYPVEVVKYKTPQWCWWALGGIVLLLVPYIVKWATKLKGLGFLI